MSCFLQFHYTLMKKSEIETYRSYITFTMRDVLWEEISGFASEKKKKYMKATNALETFSVQNCNVRNGQWRKW